MTTEVKCNGVFHFSENITGFEFQQIDFFTCNFLSPFVWKSAQMFILTSLKLNSLMKDLGGQCPVICSHDYGPRGAIAMPWSSGQPHARAPVFTSSSRLGTRFIDPPKGWMAESTLLIPGIEPGTCGVAAQNANHTQSGFIIPLSSKIKWFYKKAENVIWFSVTKNKYTQKVHAFTIKTNIWNMSESKEFRWKIDSKYAQDVYFFFPFLLNKHYF